VSDILHRDQAGRVLVVTLLTLLAAGLDPPIFGPVTQDLDSALAFRPNLEAAYLAGVIVKVAFFLVGGAIGDLAGRRRVLVVALGGLVAAEIASVLSGGSPLFEVSRLAAAACVGLAVPVAIAEASMAFHETRRATVIGLGYSAFGLGTAVAAAIVTAGSGAGGEWPAFFIAGCAGLLALAAATQWLPVGGPGPDVSRRAVVGHVLWAFGILALAIPAVGMRGSWTDPARLATLGAGLISLLLFAFWRWSGGAREPMAETRIWPVVVALLAGAALAYTESAAVLQGPLFFEVVQHSDSSGAALAMLPLTVGLLVAGPMCGPLLARLPSRTLVAGGLAAVGVGCVLLGGAGESSSYAYFLLPFALIGFGYVVGTSIRTAVILAGVSHRLPSTAAALTATSALIGAQVGIVVPYAMTADTAVRTYARTIREPLAIGASPAVDRFRHVLDAIGTAAFGPLTANLRPVVVADYSTAFAGGVSGSLALAGWVAILIAIATWFALRGQERPSSLTEQVRRVPGAQLPSDLARRGY